MNTTNSKKLIKQTLLPKLMMVVGILLMVFKIYADSEPGAIPLLLILVGAIWYFVKRFQLQSQNRME